MPKITVCVPVFNSESYIEQCLTSITNQTLQDIEIICVDDGSKDRSLEILKQFESKDSRIKVIVQASNQGVGRARNLAIAMAKGQFMSFIDSDDYIDPQMYELLYQKACENQAEIAMCDVKLMIDGGRKSKRKWFTPIEGVATPETLYKNTQPTNKIVSLDLIRREDFMFYEGNSDGVYVDLMVAANKITTVHRPMYFYRIRSQSLSSQFRVKNIQESVASCDRLLLSCKKYRDYYEFKLIEALLQLTTVAIFEGNREVYQQAKTRLKKLKYLRNPYLHTLLRKEHGWLQYMAILHLIPRSYIISRWLLKIIGWNK